MLAILLSAGVACELPAPIRRDRCVVSVYIGAKAVYRCIMVYRSEKRLVDPILQRYAHHIPIVSPLNILK